MPRLTPITSSSQVAAEFRPIADRIAESRGGIHGPFTMLLHCPPLADRVATLGAYVRFEGRLDKRIRVIAAMTVARELDVIYVWGAQTGQARRLGVPEPVITAIRERHTRGLSPEDAQIVEITRDLIHRHRIDAAKMEALRRRFDDFELIELTGTIGYYSMLAMTANALELDASPGAEVLQP